MPLGKGPYDPARFEKLMNFDCQNDFNIMRAKMSKLQSLAECPTELLSKRFRKVTFDVQQ